MALSVEQIIADGTVDEQEARELRIQLYEDGVIDRDEANMLFEINDHTSDNCQEFVKLFVDAISDHLLEDGIIDDEEVEWLVEKIEGDGEVCSTERTLLEKLDLALNGELPQAWQELL